MEEKYEDVVGEHAYVNTAANDDGIKPPIPRRKTVSKPVQKSTGPVTPTIQESNKPRQSHGQTKKMAAYVLSQNEMLLLIFISSVVAMVVAMVIMGIVIAVAVMPKIHDNGKITLSLV